MLWKLDLSGHIWSFTKTDSIAELLGLKIFNLMSVFTLCMLILA